MSARKGLTIHSKNLPNSAKASSWSLHVSIGKFPWNVDMVKQCLNRETLEFGSQFQTCKTAEMIFIILMSSHKLHTDIKVYCNNSHCNQ